MREMFESIDKNGNRFKALARKEV